MQLNRNSTSSNKVICNLQNYFSRETLSLICFPSISQDTLLIFLIIGKQLLRWIVAYFSLYFEFILYTLNRFTGSHRIRNKKSKTMLVSQTAHFGTVRLQTTRIKTCSAHIRTYTHIHKYTYICFQAHTRPGMKIAYTKMVFRGEWLMLRELEPPRYDSASWFCFVFFPLFVLLYPISLTLGYNPAVVHAENEILMTPVLSAHRSELRCVQRKPYADEKEIASSACTTCVSSLNMIDFF